MALVRFLYDNDFDSFFDDAFFPGTALVQRKKSNAPNADVASKAFRPKLDLHENKEDNLITATFELPGMKKEDIAIDVHNDHFTVSGEAGTLFESKDGDYAIRERLHGKFTRSVKLPIGVKPEDINAKMADGLLLITFPISRPENVPSRIPIN